MKKIITFILVAVMLVSIASLTVFAEDTWTVADVKFFDKTGVEIVPADGLDWTLFPYWTGEDGSQIYDSHGDGQYVTTTVNCSKFRYFSGNGGPNGHTNTEIYVDGELVASVDATSEPDGSPFYKEYEVTPGTHEIMIKAGVPAVDGWNGFCFNMIKYVAAEGGETTVTPPDTTEPDTTEPTAPANPATADIAVVLAAVAAVSGIVIGKKKK